MKNVAPCTMPAQGRGRFLIWRNAFTLIELLVCISVIAILASILLPALNKGRESAKQMKCLGSMRQMSMGMCMYANDASNYCAPLQYSSSGPFWLTNDLYISQLKVKVKDPNWGTCYWDKNFICPNATRSYNNAYLDSFRGPDFAYGLTYWSTTLIGEGQSWSKNQVTFMPNVKKPSARFLFDERIDTGAASPSSGANNLRDPSLYWWKYGNDAPLCNALAYRHGGNNRANVNYFDGHSSNFSYTDLILTTTESTSRWLPYSE